ncbi:MAG: hypothetical protein IT577_13755 [Verrucomicrobiae bacterium]|nr:hypothetical protein [Verrucomicrobiae bacterium]
MRIKVGNARLATVDCDSCDGWWASFGGEHLASDVGIGHVSSEMPQSHQRVCLAAAKAGAQSQRQPSVFRICQPTKDRPRHILQILRGVGVGEKLRRIGVHIRGAVGDKIAEVGGKYRVIQLALANLDAGLAAFEDGHCATLSALVKSVSSLTPMKRMVFGDWISLNGFI